MLLYRFQNFGDFCGGLWRGTNSSKESSQLLLLFWSVWWVAAISGQLTCNEDLGFDGKESLHVNIAGLSIEEIGHEDLVAVVLATCCEDIGTLQGLWEESKDIKDKQDGRVGR